MRRITLVSLILFLFTGCTGKPSPTGPETVNHIVISEILAGVNGNNNHDYVELYNPTLDVIDLAGYSLWYQLNASEPDTLVYSWGTTALVPPHGYYLLVREGQEAGVDADVFFESSLVPQRGSLSLKLRGAATIDQVAWGNTDALFLEGDTALAMSNGVSLERLPGGEDGNHKDSDNNRQDFTLNQSPNPQNSASQPNPAFASSLLLELSAPLDSAPGSDLEYLVTVKNTTRKLVKEVTVHFPISEDLAFTRASVEPVEQNGWMQFPLGTLGSFESKTLSIIFAAPWKYKTISIQGINVNAKDLDAPVFGGVLRTELRGGSVPIGIARTLIGSEAVVIEGIATMYTGGFYAGSSGTKFYVEDETGGVQVFVPGGAGAVEIPMDARVRVKGSIEPYRGAIELVPSPNDIEIINLPGQKQPREPLTVSAKDLLIDPGKYAGKLVTLSGEVKRVDEFSYSFEMDLLDDGVMIGAYIDKLTEINVEVVAVGQYYQVTGIAEFLDDILRINPRIQTDLVEVQPPAVTLSAKMPVNYDAAQLIPIEILINNHLSTEIRNVEVSLVIPEGFRVEDISGDGKLSGDIVTWRVSQIPGNGAQRIFSLTGKAATAQKYLVLEDYSLSYHGQTTPLLGEMVYSFPGDRVPVWAIQGPGSRSPYLLQSVRTSGVVTGVFPDLEGFWIQGIEDGDPLTSQGLFVYTLDPNLNIKPGDQVTVDGVIHESHSETQLFLDNLQVTGVNQQVPTAVVLDPPAEEVASDKYYESLEGMLVKVNGDAIAVSATNKFGETALALSSFSETHLMQGDQNGFAIRVDDGSFVTHKDQSTMLYSAATGDTITSLKGPLAFNYGYFKIEPLTAPRVIAEDRILPKIPAAGTDQIRIMTWNVENLFDYLLPHPTDPALPSVAEYKAWLEKIANTILLAGTPAVVGLQEVEHIGILEDIADTRQLKPYGYQAVLMEGTDSRGIDVGYLVRGDVKIMDSEQFPAPEDLTSRPPLLLIVQVEVNSSTQTLYLLNNHFLSMSGGELATEPRRVAQAAWNVSLVKQLQAEDPKAQVIVLGDLNSYFDSPPILTFRNGGMTHVFDTLEPEERYTYIYQGIAQVLDHILVNGNLADNISRVDILHVNSDYPLQLPGDTSVLHKSDHDPVLVTLDF